MGCSQTSESDDIDRDLEEDRLASERVYKLLLLGTGNSGKSTFLKQVSNINGKTAPVKHLTVTSIRENLLQQMANILRVYEETTDDNDFDSLEEPVRIAAMNIRDSYGAGNLADSVADIKLLWSDPRIQDVYYNRKTLSIVDSAKFFFENVDRIAHEHYSPTQEDYLLVRVKTSGFTSVEFKFEGSSFALFDVGGQRNERNKWINCFNTVAAVLYVASLSCYNQVLHEDEDVNALDESLDLFEETVNNRHFRHVSMILFLNKSDLFREKIENREAGEINLLRTYFDDYKGQDWSFDDGVSFILDRYKNLSNFDESEKPIFHYVTCAVDTDQTRALFDAVQNQVVLKAMKRVGLV